MNSHHQQDQDLPTPPKGDGDGVARSLMADFALPAACPQPGCGAKLRLSYDRGEATLAIYHGEDRIGLMLLGLAAGIFGPQHTIALALEFVHTALSSVASLHRRGALTYAGDGPQEPQEQQEEGS